MLITESIPDSGVHDNDRLRELQAMPLERKIRVTQTRIMEWYYHYNGKAYVSFSGGKDSTALLVIARKAFPDIPAVFFNTGLEFPEIQKFAQSFDNVTVLRPRWGRLGAANGHAPDDQFSFKDVVTMYGYPLISKQVANAIEQSRQSPKGSRWARLHGEYRGRDGGRSPYDYSKYLPLYDLPLKITESCCKVMKKGPSHSFMRSTGLMPIIATMADESLVRKQVWLSTGCNAFTAAAPISKPMSFWTEQDVLELLVRAGIPICSVYGDIKRDEKTGKLACTGCQRTGCMFCGFGLHLEKGETRFQRIAWTHPKQYDFCINGGQWSDNPDYDATLFDNDPKWNPKKIWTPSDKGLGMGKTFGMVNNIYGKDFMRYE